MFALCGAPVHNLGLIAVVLLTPDVFLVDPELIKEIGY
jgi:hypothetical protein